MRKTVLIVLFLSFGAITFSQTKLDKLRESRLAGLMLIPADDFQSANLPEIFGLEPSIPIALSLVKQTAPMVFAGALSNFLSPDGKLQQWLRQKEKLAGLVVWRTTTCLSPLIKHQ